MLTLDAFRPQGIDPIHMTVEAGDCLALTGPSGAGKSVLLRAIADLDPNEGGLALEGVDKTALPAPHWRSQVIYLATDSGWWAERVAEHFVDWPSSRNLAVGLGLPEDCGEWTVDRLSTGEKQRLAIVRALERTPKVLLLDEATSGLDEVSTAKVEALLRKFLKGGGAIIAVTHNKAQAKRIASRIMTMSKGKLTGARP